MSDIEHARRAIAIAQTLNNSIEKLVQEEVDLGKIVGTRSKITPDSLAIAAGRVQLIAVGKAVGEIAILLAEHLTECAEEREAGGV